MTFIFSIFYFFLIMISIYHKFILFCFTQKVDTGFPVSIKLIYTFFDQRCSKMKETVLLC